MTSRAEKVLMDLEAELVGKIKKLAEELLPLEGELLEVRRALTAIRDVEPAKRVKAEDEFEPYQIDEFARFRSLSMKELTLKALKEHFRDGATAQQLLAYFRDAYGRDIERSSLSPQLTRLKIDNKIVREGNNIWKLHQLTTPPESEGVSNFTVEEVPGKSGLFD